MNQPSTIHKILKLVRMLSEGDRQRVLKFVEGITGDREGKKATRRKRFSPPEPDDSWRVGS